MTAPLFEVSGSIRGAHADGANLLRFWIDDADPSAPDLGDEILVRDPELTEAWGRVVELLRDTERPGEIGITIRARIAVTKEEGGGP